MIASISSRTNSCVRCMIARIFEEPGDVVQRPCHVLDAEVRDAHERRAPFFFELLARCVIEPEHCTTFSAAPCARRISSTRPSPVMQETTSTPMRLKYSRIIQISPARLKSPRMLMLIGLMPSVGRGSDQLEQRLAGRLIAIFLRPLESFGVHRQNRNSLFAADSFADGLHVIADNAHDAGGIDKCGFWLMRVDQLAQAA